MAKACHDEVLDQGLEYIYDNCNLMVACSAQPTTRAEGVTTYALADAAITPASDIAIANGDVSGRKATIAAKNGVTIDATGTANHVALVSATELLYVTTCTSLAL